MPTRLRISWDNDTDAEGGVGQRTADSLVQLSGAWSVPRVARRRRSTKLAGISVARWETQPEGPGLCRRLAVAAVPPSPSGALKVVTTSLGPGYLRSNGAPYSGQAVFTEYFDRVPGPNNESWLIVTSILDDPTYLDQPFMLTTQFKREAGCAKFNPRPCEMTPPVEGEAAAAERGRGAAAPAGRGAPPDGAAGRGRGN